MDNLPIKVLYIDDDDGLRRLIERRLVRLGMQVETAASGEYGIARLMQGSIDVVALDQYMPGLDGLETLGRIRALDDPPPVVFVTGAQESRIAVAALKAGAVDYVIKEVQGEFVPLLHAALSSAVESAQLRRAKEEAEAEVRRARDRFEALAAERAMLLREVNHRVGNSLQLVATFLNMQGRVANHPNVNAALEQARGRVMAIAQIHRSLYTSDDMQSVSLDEYLRGLLNDLQRTADGRNAVELTLDTSGPILVHPDTAVAIGVIVNELVINALKHAYPEGEGTIRVGLCTPSPQRALLTVEDKGLGMGDTGASGSGLGKTIIGAMATKLGGEMIYADARPGTRALIEFGIDAERSPFAC